MWRYPSRMRVAYQGEAGAYSERAVLALFPDADPMPCETIRLVFSRVTSGEADFGVVPVENSQAGSVNESYDLLLRSSLVGITGEVMIRVDQRQPSVRMAVRRNACPAANRLRARAASRGLNLRLPTKASVSIAANQAACKVTIQR